MCVCVEGFEGGSCALRCAVRVTTIWCTRVRDAHTREGAAHPNGTHELEGERRGDEMPAQFSCCHRRSPGVGSGVREIMREMGGHGAVGFHAGPCVFSGKNHSVCRRWGKIVITPPSRLGGGATMPMFDPQPCRGSWYRELDDEVGHRPGARQQVLHGRGQVRGEAADLLRSTALKE